MQNVKAEQEVINLSKEKWRWMSERQVDPLAALFHEKAGKQETRCLINARQRKASLSSKPLGHIFASIRIDKLEHMFYNNRLT